MAAASELRAENRDGLANQLKALWRGRFERNAQVLTKLRNDKHHGGKKERSSSIAEKTRGKLAECFEDLAFLIKFPVIRVFNPDVPRTGMWIHQVEIYKGDHPAHEHATIEREVPLPASLYVMTDEGPKDLFPFVSVRECDTCGELETFFLDKREKGATWSVKSFEHSHPLKAEDIAAALEAWSSGR